MPLERPLLLTTTTTVRFVPQLMLLFLMLLQQWLLLQAKSSVPPSFLAVQFPALAQVSHRRFGRGNTPFALNLVLLQIHIMP